MSEVPPHPDTAPSRLRPEAHFLLLALPFGLLYAAVFPPFSIADEPAHFLRAYTIATGTLMPERRAEGAGAVLPASLPRLIFDLAGDLPLNYVRKIDPRATFAAFARPLAPAETVWVDFRNSAAASPLPYLPAAVGIGLGRLVSAPPLAMFYLARLANLCAGCALLWAALRLAPTRRLLGAAIALLPMTVGLLAAVSADVVLIGLAFLWTALVARACLQEERPPGEAIQLTVVAAALCLTKLPYVALVALAALIPARRFGAQRWRFLSVLLGASAAATGFSLWGWRRIDLPIREGAGVDTVRQLQDLLTEPLWFAQVLIRDSIGKAMRYGVQFLGSDLGWLDAEVPLFAICACLALIVWLALADVSPAGLPTTRQRIVLGLVLIAAWALVAASQYVIYTPYRHPEVEGIQGRYLLPLAPAAALLLQSRRVAGRFQPQRFTLAIVALQASILVAALWGVVARYYLA